MNFINNRYSSNWSPKKNSETVESIERDIKNMDYDIGKTKQRLKSVFLKIEDKDFQQKVLDNQLKIVSDLKEKLKKLKKEKQSR
jgi:hypothetical protein